MCAVVVVVVVSFVVVVVKVGKTLFVPFVFVESMFFRVVWCVLLRLLAGRMNCLGRLHYSWITVESVVYIIDARVVLRFDVVGFLEDFVGDVPLNDLRNLSPTFLRFALRSPLFAAFVGLWLVECVPVHEISQLPCVWRAGALILWAVCLAPEVPAAPTRIIVSRVAQLTAPEDGECRVSLAVEPFAFAAFGFAFALRHRPACFPER